MTKYFFDTYALIEVIKKNPNYAAFFDEIVNTGVLNTIELYYSILKDLGEEKAKIAYYRFHESDLQISDEVIFDAMKLKLTNKQLSYADCIGYALALKNNLKFLTGDKEFKSMGNVEFVK